LQGELKNMQKALLLITFTLLLSTANCQDRPGAAKGNIFRMPAKGSSNSLVKQWTYHFEPMTDTTDKRKVLPMATITFRRRQPVPATGAEKAWYPIMRFEIYTEADSAYCHNYGNSVNLLSSCVAPNAGGDCIKIGHFILVNPDVCLTCAGQNGTDYCRASIGYFLRRITRRQTKDIYELIEQLPIEAD
jgi:hypothetical protein